MTKHQQPQSLHKSQDAGYTIIESIVAMVVVSVLMIAIAPVMAFSVATRVQAKRVEMATQAARTYIDALRSGALKQGDRGFPVGNATKDLENTAAPDVSTPNPYYCIDNDATGDCEPSSNQDLLVQGYYFNNNAPTPPTKTGYNLIVRVYRAGSFAGVGALKTQQQLGSQQGISSSGLGNLRAPLVELRTEIGGTDRRGAYNSFCDRQGGCN